MTDQNRIGHASLTAQLFDTAGNLAGGTADVEHHALQISNEVVDRLAHLIDFIMPFDGNASSQVCIAGRQRVDVDFQNAQAIHQRAQGDDHQDQQYQNHRDLQPGQGLENRGALAFQQIGILRDRQQPRRACDRHQK